MSGVITIRTSTAEDAAALDAIDRATWTLGASVAPAPRRPGTPFFEPDANHADVLVAEAGGTVAGYVRIGPAEPAVESNRHVLMVRGFAVDPGRHRQGIGRRLIDAAVDAARARGARRLTLRVLADNAAARALYEAAGFRVEGVLREEFLLGGRYVDDVLMARDLALAAPLRER
jgi:ribosomal protein S18 acetylase RimI-like enzyme